MNQINHKIEEIAEQEQAIADQQAVIDERWEGFQNRMLAMQIMHDSGAVAMITSAQSMYDLLNFSKALQQISQKDTEILEEMNRQRQILEEEKSKLEAAKGDLESAKTSLESKQSQLAENIRQQDQNISTQDALAQAQSEVVAEAQKRADEAERQYDAWIKQNASSGSGQSAEGFIWPLPAGSPGRVTCEFGATQNINGVISPGHKGMDIGGLPIGTPIVASHNGVGKATAPQLDLWQCGDD
ncbi:peptidase, M23/M37 family [gut metagenome]|uniref:Peptidase, M23/M37 family n=1 Tax=gut metagenome TaxID=749906 RepID=J9G8E4_9ZZZZ